MEKPYFDLVDPKVNFPELEEKILKFWKKEKIFEKSVKLRSDDKKWTFLDGPPFITGLPHYGSLLSSIPKDLFPRYKTMRGFKVRRVWGWDCHGLPAENKVEKKLGIKSKKEIEKIGIKKFIEECKLYVSKTSSEWEWYVDHIARWVDFKKAYKTMDLPYMETVMWVFKQMYSKGFIYKGLRVSLYCPHCETPISNFEVAMDAENYKDLSEFATTYKYQLEGEKDTYLLAWSTTPWNKIATDALAINSDLVYAKVRQGEELYILAKDTLKMLKETPKYEVLEEFKGVELVGKKFVPHYDYYKDKVKDGEKAFVVVPANYVSAEEGTGVVTLAAYGEEDLDIMQKENIHMEMHITSDGYIKKSVPKFGGMNYLDSNEAVDADLKERGLIYDKGSITHSIPHCWRCATRLFHNPQDAWFVDVQSLKPKLIKNNRKVSWVPKHFKYGRFLNSMEAAPDWCISRSRYWGSPVPVWICEDCGESLVFGSLRDLEEASGKKINDLHKPDIDEITVRCSKCGGVARRVPEVLDSWIEAGSATFAERHFPFEKTSKLEDFFPPDFIVEYTGQIRAWFYVLHVIATALFDSYAFKNVVVTGVILGTDGRKMSKNYGNYPDPKVMLQTYGGDALRLYFMGSPVMKGEDVRISEEDYKNQVRGFLLILWNCYNFFVTYANSDRWKPSNARLKPNDVLDRWIISRMFGTIDNITQKGYEKFDTTEIVGQAFTFLMDLSHWYIRRIRARVGSNVPDSKDKNEAYATMYFVLKEYIKVLSPIIPNVTEEIYKNLTKEESVHLSLWPEIVEDLRDSKLEGEMERLRNVAVKAHAERKRLSIPVRQPLLSLATTYSFKPSFQAILKDELNVKKIIRGKEIATLDHRVTPELEEEGKTRELIRKIQEERKRLGIKLTQKVIVKSPWIPQSNELTQKVKTLTLAGEFGLGEFEVKPTKDE